MDTLIQIAEDEGDDSKAKYLWEIKNKKQSKEVHTRIKWAQGKQRGGGGVRFVHKMEKDGRVKTIRNKEQMEEEI